MPVLIKKQVKPIFLDYKPRGLIMGPTGNGKTTLLNNICGTNHEARDAEESVTRKLFLSKNAQGEHGFELIDTPGTNS